MCIRDRSSFALSTGKFILNEKENEYEVQSGKRKDVYKRQYHSASHGYIADVLNKEKTEYAAISCHLGGSSSVCAILNGKSVDTSFGMSLESGLIHANLSLIHI